MSDSAQLVAYVGSPALQLMAELLVCQPLIAIQGKDFNNSSQQRGINLESGFLFVHCHSWRMENVASVVTGQFDSREGKFIPNLCETSRMALGPAHFYIQYILGVISMREVGRYSQLTTGEVQNGRRHVYI